MQETERSEEKSECNDNERTETSLMVLMFSDWRRRRRREASFIRSSSHNFKAVGFSLFRVLLLFMPKFLIIPLKLFLNLARS